MVPSWTEIERADGFQGLQALVESTVLPDLEIVPQEVLSESGAPERLARPTMMAFGIFIALFLSTFLWLPDTWWGTLLRFVCFFLFFLFSVGLVLYLKRKTIVQFIGRSERRLAARSNALRHICDHLGITYVGTPGGVPAPLAWFARQGWAPQELRALTDRMEQEGGMDAPVRIARDLGLMQGNVIVLGTASQRAKYAEQAEATARVEDGFCGHRAGIRFDMFEWVEDVDEAPDIHHLVIVLAAPFMLHGVTHLRARKTGWLQAPAGVTLRDVDLGPRAFDALYKLRASDQTEARALFNPAVIERVIALAHGGKFRAVASGSHLVFDFAGDNRFNLLDLHTGVWSDDTIRGAVSDIAEALALVDALAHAFMLRKQAPDGSRS